MKQFIYKSSVMGLSEWPSGTLRLEGIEITENPSEADVFVCPGHIRIFEGTPGSGLLDIHKLRRLPHFRGNESRSIFFDVSDNFTKPLNLPIIFIRCDVRTWMLAKDPNTIPMPWPVEDFQECVTVPASGFKFDVSFQGWLSTDVRIEASKSCRQHPGLTSDITEYADFTGYIYDQPEGLRRRQEFRRSMTESRVALCGESIPGVMPYRFYEAMSAGRVPFLIGSDYVLPMTDEIPYDDFILRAEAKDASKAGTIVKDFISRHSDAELIEKGKLARFYWSTWLNSRDWPKHHAYAVQKHFAKVAV